jgi:chorismate dehydratase
MHAVSRPPLLRVGAVSFLNTVPLIEGLQDDPEIELQRDLPSRLADLLFENRIDVGLIPIVEYLRGVGSDLVPGICIGSRGPVRTVKVFSKVPLEKAGDIAVDRGSRSSVALLRVLLAERFDHHPDLHVVEPRPDALFAHYDTVLVIGDRAEQVRDLDLYVYDLGQMWTDLTGLPFVYAAWVLGPALGGVGREERKRTLVQRLQRAKAGGLSALDELAIKESRSRAIPVERILSYWRESIHFDLGSDELAGLQKFAELAARHNLVPSERAVCVAEA